MSHRVSWVVTAAAVALVGSGCVANTAAPGDQAGAAEHGTLSVTSTDTTCELSAEQAPAGTVTFQVTNSSKQVTEFYLLAGDGRRIVGEVENIGPGLTRNLVVSATEGDYVAVCKPGMTGQGIRSDFVVSGGAAAPADQSDGASVQRAKRSYGAYVRDQGDQLLARTGDFVAAYTAGQDDRARALYPRARVH